jgi:Leucine-rich repeat (LRR) protein
LVRLPCNKKKMIQIKLVRREPMKKFVYLALAILIVCTSSNPAVALKATDNEFSCLDVTEIPQLECGALVALYSSTNGDNWVNNTNWLVTNTPSNWFGVSVNSGYVTSLSLNYNQLNGSLPSELGNLTSLIEIDLVSNQLTGSIPPELGNLIGLTSLSLSWNQLTGSIPAELGNLSNLTWLHLGGNQLTGSIPPELGNLTSLRYLYLWLNQLSGSLPPELGNLTNLKAFNLQSNQLTGSIPSELGNLTNLVDYLVLRTNQLSGSIPPELGDLISLKWLDMGHNQLTGNIPPELGDLISLTGLDLGWNQLTGSLPPELGNLTNLGGLRLGVNQLTGNIPSELGSLTNLTDIDLYGNQLTGSIPHELGNLTSLTSLALYSNQLSGSIPPELGNLINLQILRLNDNQLEADVPDTLINLINLLDPGMVWDGGDGLDLDSNLLNVPPGYPVPGNPLHDFLSQKDPDWQFYQGFQQVIGAGGGELTSLDGKTDFQIPSGALDGDTSFTFIPLPAPRHASGWMVFGNNSFDLNAEDELGDPVLSFNIPVTVTLSYEDSEVIGPEDNIALDYWNGEASLWTDAVTTCPGGEYTRDLVDNQLALPLCHLTEFGLFGNPLNLFLPLIRR